MSGGAAAITPTSTATPASRSTCALDGLDAYSQGLLFCDLSDNVNLPRNACWDDKQQLWVHNGDGRGRTGKKRLSGCSPVCCVLPWTFLRVHFAEQNLAKGYRARKMEIDQMLDMTLMSMSNLGKFEELRGVRRMASVCAFLLPHAHSLLFAPVRSRLKVCQCKRSANMALVKQIGSGSSSGKKGKTRGCWGWCG